MFGKLMSVSDELMWRYIELLSFEPTGDHRQWKREVKQGRNPRDIKVMFAQEIVARFHSNTGRAKGACRFRGAFQARRDPGRYAGENAA